jgi:heme/copper-type cytochrome/quinol oxidase subunit 2
MTPNDMGGLILAVIALACYFLPTIVASSRGKANGTGGVFFANLLLGWTVAGWFVAFIWACSGTTKADEATRDRQHRELLEVVAAGGRAIPVMPAREPEYASLYERACTARARQDAPAI